MRIVVALSVLAAIVFPGGCDVPSAGLLACGGGEHCPAGWFCKYDEGVCGADSAIGACTQQPASCAMLADGVCGCDGTFYGNACLAAAEGVSVANEGECPGSTLGTVCGGIAGAACDEDQFCQFDAGTCGQSDLQGVCTRAPLACSVVIVPVCGCDGRDYTNECLAQQAGVNVASEGFCFEQ